MHGLVDWWFFAGRHRELLEEASRHRRARGLSRAKERRSRSLSAGDQRRAAFERAEVRRTFAVDAPRIAALMEVNGVPRWVAFEGRFIVAEEAGRLVVGYRDLAMSSLSDLRRKATPPGGRSLARCSGLCSRTTRPGGNFSVDRGRPDGRKAPPSGLRFRDGS